MTTAPAVETLAERLLAHGGQQARAIRVTRIPAATRRQLLTQLTSPLVSAYQATAKVFASWVHTAGGPFTVHVGGTHGFPAFSRDEAQGSGRLLFPPGARGVDDGAAVDAIGADLEATPWWVRLGGVLDPSAGHSDDPEAIEDHLPFLSETPFRLLTIAIPVAVDEVAARQEQLRQALQADTDRLERGIADLSSQRNRAQLQEHTTALAAGLWRVHAFAGADTAAEAAQVAALWAAAAQSNGPTTYRFAPVSAPATLRDAVAATTAGGDAFSLAAPFTAGSALLAGLCRPPLDEIPGVEARAPNRFDVASAGPGEVTFGDILDVAGAPVGRLRVPLTSLAKHTFVHGATGAGKSQATRHLLTEFTRLGIPWVVLEPAKSEYAAGMQQRLDAIRGDLADSALADVHVIRPGDAAATPAALNPLQPERGFNYQAHLDMLVDLMVAAFDADSPFPEVLAQGVDLAVREAGWDAALSEAVRAVADRFPQGGGPSYPDVADLVRACHAVIDAKGYGREVAGNVHGFVDMRLGTLTTGTKRAAFTAGYPLSLEKVLQHNVVLELQDLGTDSDRALYMGLFLARLSQAVRVRHRRDPRHGMVRNVVVVEEAHRLLRNPEDLEGAAARAVESFTDLLAEVRSQGVALIIAEQIPHKIAPDAVKNTAVKCMGRTPARDDRDFVGASIGLTEQQSAQVVSLPPGAFAVHTDGDDRPLLVHFPYVAEHADDRAHDPAPLVDDLPDWFGAAGPAGAARQRDLAWAAQALDDPRLVTLCELTLLSHLCHQPLPVISPSAAPHLLRAFGGTTDGRAVDVAVGTIVAGGVKNRRDVLGANTPEHLAATVAACVRERLSGGGPAVPHPRWRSRPHQWLAIKAALEARSTEEPSHPDSDRWRSWGVDYADGDTVGAQRVHLLRSTVNRRDDVTTALLGRTRPGQLQRAVAATGYGFADGLSHLLRMVANAAALQPLCEALDDAMTSDRRTR